MKWDYAEELGNDRLTWNILQNVSIHKPQINIKWHSLQAEYLFCKIFGARNPLHFGNIFTVLSWTSTWTSSVRKPQILTLHVHQSSESEACNITMSGMLNLYMAKIFLLRICVYILLCVCVHFCECVRLSQCKCLICMWRSEELRCQSSPSTLLETASLCFMAASATVAGLNAFGDVPVSTFISP